ncbi:hypothetical protein E1A91_A04G093700v1 [Gossypium mustelinum]|uniref:Uncharacterized protein n=1 Tax=Gossypium mustelinum TaxID=34275 RepID=A0A5D2ZNS5_GOSMU|nr:hypothetical protein E1A91_A04G093700v1 [Gossypium mustelinum]
MRTQKRGTSCEIYPFRVKMHKFTHLERRLICFFFNQKKIIKTHLLLKNKGYSIFEPPIVLLRQIKEKQLNRHFEPSFDFREGFSGPRRWVQVWRRERNTYMERTWRREMRVWCEGGGGAGQRECLSARVCCFWKKTLGHSIGLKVLG